MLAAANLSIRHHSVAVRAQVFLSLLRYLDVEVDIGMSVGITNGGHLGTRWIASDPYRSLHLGGTMLVFKQHRRLVTFQGNAFDEPPFITIESASANLDGAWP